MWYHWSENSMWYHQGLEFGIVGDMAVKGIIRARTWYMGLLGLEQYVGLLQARKWDYFSGIVGARTSRIAGDRAWDCWGLDNKWDCWGYGSKSNCWGYDMGLLGLGHEIVEARTISGIVGARTISGIVGARTISRIAGDRAWDLIVRARTDSKWDLGLLGQGLVLQQYAKYVGLLGQGHGIVGARTDNMWDLGLDGLGHGIIEARTISGIWDLGLLGLGHGIVGARTDNKWDCWGEDMGLLGLRHGIIVETRTISGIARARAFHQG
ncbi:hypothetical protein DPMN_075845 [Dreissena polymorpha]|uniref:Uncharacterized protein n=1 Tax=Dreissena polymorpha TaxID=45954 RepID=A0A9D4BLV8_DREPO|nr:hypothetical protein DPMN_075845 [Dreissena polymorpha]